MEEGTLLEEAQSPTSEVAQRATSGTMDRMADAITKADFLREARTVLATIYPSNRRAEIIAWDVGLDATRINMWGAPIDVWFEVLREAELQGRVEALIQSARRDYPMNPQLAELAKRVAALTAETATPTVGEELRLLSVCSATDASRVAALLGAFRSAGFATVSTEDFASIGEASQLAAVRGIESTDAAVVFVSASLLSREQTLLDEIARSRASRPGYLIAPVRLDDSALPTSLQNFVAFDAGDDESTLVDAARRFYTSVARRRGSPSLAAELESITDPLSEFVYRLSGAAK